MHRLILYRDGEEMVEVVKEEGEEGEVVASTVVEPSTEVQHVVCEARNEVARGPLRTDAFIPAAPPPPPRQAAPPPPSRPSSTLTIPTLPPRAEAQEDRRRRKKVG